MTTLCKSDDKRGSGAYRSNRRLLVPEMSHVQVAWHNKISRDVWVKYLADHPAPRFTHLSPFDPPHGPPTRTHPESGQRASSIFSLTSRSPSPRSRRQYRQTSRPTSSSPAQEPATLLQPIMLTILCKLTIPTKSASLDLSHPPDPRSTADHLA